MKHASSLALLGLAGLLAPLACVSLDPAAPLGSVGNPVRADRLTGELDYLFRLRCPDATQPHVQRLPRRVKGPYGNMLDGYRVRCIYLNAESRIYLDPFHEDFVEREPVAGFTVAATDRADWLLRLLRARP